MSEKTQQQMEDELAKQRLEEEMKKIQLETEEERKAKMRALIGEDAENVGARKKGVDDSVQKWSEKGKHHPEQSSVQAVEQRGDTVKSVKQAYADQLKANATKGKHMDDFDEGEAAQPHHLSPEEIKKRFAKRTSDVPALFGSSGTGTSSQEKGNDDEPQPPPEESYKSEFSSIESEEETMVGREKHIKITGIDLQGRKMTKTKIILPKVEGKTVQQGSRPANPDNQLEPKEWDGTFHSFEDIRQRRVEDLIDTQHREQYLSPEDFEAHFKMTKEAFAKFPKWKRDKIKKDLYLF